MNRQLYFPLIACIPIVLAGCVGPRAAEPMRAIWVTRMDYKTPDDVTRILDHCAAAGFNTVLFQVRGNATAFYDSPYEPWAEQFGFQDPGFDPLELACREARARDLELHAWVNAMPGWRGEQPPAEPTQLYHAHPEWFWYDQYGERQKLSWFYVSLNPCLPEVREYLAKVFGDIVERYDVDGLHLDYIRFPKEPPATPRGSDIDYPHDARTLALFKAETGQTPEADPEAWSAWRTAQVTRLVEQIRAAVRRANPRAALTVAASAARERAVANYYQDAATWMERGLVDAVILMNYTDDPELFAARLEPWRGLPGDGALVPGLSFRGTENQTWAEDVAAVQRQIEIARETTGNFCVFAYASLFERRPASGAEGADGARAGEEPSLRAYRREQLVPWLAELAAQDDG